MDYIHVASLVIVVLVLTCGQTHTQTDADERFAFATLIGVSNYKSHNND